MSYIWFISNKGVAPCKFFKGKCITLLAPLPVHGLITHYPLVRKAFQFCFYVCYVGTELWFPCNKGVASCSFFKFKYISQAPLAASIFSLNALILSLKFNFDLSLCLSVSLSLCLSVSLSLCLSVSLSLFS